MSIGLVILYQVIAVLTIIHVVMDNRQPAKTMAWALVIWFVPVVGIVLYLFFGINTRKERLVSQRSLDQLSKRSMLQYVEQQNLQLPDLHKPIIDLFINENFSLPFRLSSVDVYTDGYQFFPALLREIASAKSHIHIDMYIFEDDALGYLVSDALIEKARQGVEVRVIIDDVGCWNVSHRFFERMREEGIEVVPFLPVRFPSFTSKVNYRNHRKLIIVDGHVGFIGGMNIALRYVKGVTVSHGRKATAQGDASRLSWFRRVLSRLGHSCVPLVASDQGSSAGKHDSSRCFLPWRDTMLRVTGGGVYSLQRAFLIDWYFVDRTLLSDRKYYPQCTMHHAQSPMLNAQCSLFQTVTSGPVTPYPEIMQGYVHIILGARRYIYIETPYFLPTEPVLFALKTAAAAGIDVRLLVPGGSDAWFADWASRSYLREAAKAGIRVSLYMGGFLHSKLMVCDDNICTCGSTNVDFRSFENNFEANAFIYGEEVALRLKQVFMDDEAQSTALTDLPDRMHPKFFVRLWESIVRMLSPLM